MKNRSLIILIATVTLNYAAHKKELACTGNDIHPSQILFWEAIYHNNNEQLKKVLSEDDAPSVNQQDEYGNVPLIFATWNNQLDVIKTLVEEGHASLDQKDQFKKTALIWAIGKDVNSKTNLFNNNETIMFLVNQGADINVADAHGTTPLMYAIQNNRADIVEFLLKKGADYSNENDEGVSPLTLAIDKGNLTMASILIGHDASLVNRKDRHGRTPLMWAVAFDRPEMVKLLLSKQANPNIKNKKDDDKRAIDYASQKNSKNMSEIFETCVVKRQSKKSLTLK